jgi:preprotein translocase SecE subunit
VAEEAKQPRRIRKVETVREKAEKSAEAGKQPGRIRKVASGAAAPLRPVGRGAQRVGRFKPVYIVGLILVPRYLRNSFRELRQVTWPNRKESRQLTLAVILFAIIFGALVAVIDFGLDKVFKQVLLK